MDAVSARRTLHTKRSFASRHSAGLAHVRAPDSPAAYDASEEDNDPLTDDAADAASLSVARPAIAARTRPAPRTRLLVSLSDTDDAGTDSPTYDGDIESSSTLTFREAPSPAPSLPTQETTAKGNPAEPPPASIAVDAFNPAKLTPDDIQAYIRSVIRGDDPVPRTYRINEPPRGRPARVYADGVYDLFHFGHALQLRQAKLSFPPVDDPNHPPSPPVPAPSHALHTPTADTPSALVSPPIEHAAPAGRIPGVYLLVGVNSDEQCAEHKNMPVMNHAERCEAVRHCRWVDEVVADAPWVIDEEFLQKHQIDYVAHDEDPYVSGDLDDVYGYCKRQGKFIPTRRTPGVSTSELLERIVSRYRMRVFDKKLARMGHAELMAEGSDYDDSAPGSVRVSRAGSPGLGTAGMGRAEM